MRGRTDGGHHCIQFFLREHLFAPSLPGDVECETQIFSGKKRGKGCGAAWMRHDIFFSNIPTSGMKSARRAVVVSRESRLSQAVLFSACCRAVSRKYISHNLVRFCAAAALRAL